MFKEEGKNVAANLKGLEGQYESTSLARIDLQVQLDEQREKFNTLEDQKEYAIMTDTPKEMFINPTTGKTSVGYTDKVVAGLLNEDREYIECKSVLSILEENMSRNTMILDVLRTKIGIQKALLAFYTAYAS